MAMEGKSMSCPRAQTHQAISSCCILCSCCSTSCSCFRLARSIIRELRSARGRVVSARVEEKGSEDGAVQCQTPLPSLRRELAAVSCSS